MIHPKTWGCCKCGRKINEETEWVLGDEALCRECYMDEIVDCDC